MTIREMLQRVIDDIWCSTDDEPITVEQVLDWDADIANLSDVARLPLMALANYTRAGANAVRLYGEVTAMADAANFAPDPRRLTKELKDGKANP